MTSTVTAVNQTQSLAAIRNFVRASVSCITYARGLCSENAFEQRPFLGVPLRQLIPSTAESLAISEWIERGAFDALNRSYLKEMALCVYDAKCTALLESYCFGFNYSSDGQRANMSLAALQTIKNAETAQGVAGMELSTGNMALRGSDAGTKSYHRRRCTKQEVQRMLANILERLMDIVETLPPLLSERVLTMRLSYYDEITPATYEPPCFAPASEHMKHLYRDEVKHHIHVGSMDTSYHLFSVAVRHPLLQQIQRQLSQTTAASTAAGSGSEDYDGVAAASAPLRSGLNSTFSSHAEVPKMLEEKTSLGRPQKHLHLDEGLEQQRAPSDGAAASCGDSGDAAGTDRSLCSSGADGVQLKANDEVCEAREVAHLGSVGQLLGEIDHGKHQRILRPAETVYLLFTAFLFSKAPSASSGRGRFTAAEVHTYRTHHCPLDVSEDVAAAILHKLCAEGLAHAPQGQPRNGLPAISIHEWTVEDPPLPLLQKLLRLGQLTQLLSHQCNTELHELSMYLEREEARKRSPKAQEKRGATEASRKRRLR